MSIYITHFDEQSKVQHLSADGDAIGLGALVALAPEPGYKVDLEDYVAHAIAGRKYRVIGIEALNSAYNERLGIELERNARRQINAGKERWYAAVKLAVVLTNEDGSLARIDKSPGETFLERYLRCTVPAEILSVLDAGNGKEPVADVDYSISTYEHLYPKYQALDQTCDEWSNRPTACLALFLLSDQQVRVQLKTSVTAKGQLTTAKLMQLAKRERWIEKAVPADAYFTDPFPEFAPYRQEVNYDEIAQELTALHKAGEL
ncbi:hypothetical protein LMG26857_03512 [Achromobacter anxifer]|uniref:hypothetical protein n=1 Tax=Achromobacter anxifer TaxID=1287737 RepID=UPI00155D41B5|nr:hypothetical protein [Achromobacter anxifer]CAB5514453.1 hypothetical protein LMG26857_03512 [Achromobacter anxifer]